MTKIDPVEVIKAWLATVPYVIPPVFHADISNQIVAALEAAGVRLMHKDGVTVGMCAAAEHAPAEPFGVETAIKAAIDAAPTFAMDGGKQ